jgi:hypothetical protein
VLIYYIIFCNQYSLNPRGILRGSEKHDRGKAGGLQPEAWELSGEDGSYDGWKGLSFQKY